MSTKIVVKKIESRLPVTIVTDNTGPYVIFTVDSQEVTLDFGDLPQIIGKELKYNHYIRVDNVFLPELLLDNKDYLYVDGNIFNNRRSNLKIVKPTKDTIRKYDIVLPKYIYFHGETAERGEYFYIEIKSNGEYIFRKKTTQNRSVTREEKLKEAKSILVNALREHPEWRIYSELLNDPTIPTEITSHKKASEIYNIDLPRHIRYVAEKGPRGSFYSYEIRKPKRICIKSTSAKKMDDKSKYEDLLKKLSNEGISV